jgi:hypothetical protein
MQHELIVTKQYALKLILTKEDVDNLRGICRAWKEQQRLLPDPNEYEALLVERLLRLDVPPTSTYEDERDAEEGF